MNPALRRSAAHAIVTTIETPQLDEIDQHHFARVLRLRAGETVSVSDGAGAWRLCHFMDGGALAVASEITIEQPRPHPLTVGFALPKGDRPEWIVQKLTEIGIDRMIIVGAQRSVTKWDPDRRARSITKLGRVAREASMQSRRVWLPVIDGPITLTELAGRADIDPAGMALAEPEGQPLMSTDTCVLVGPEGGWTPDELAAFPRHVSLGDSILRVETAALVAGALLAAGGRS